jgi:RHS repeat-associated protein
VAVTDASGALLSEQRYLPFGEVRTDVQSSITQTDYGYTGQRDLDAQGTYFDIGLMDYRARLYDDYLMRWTQPDSIINPGPQGLNRYSYSNNNPINYNDPSGHCARVYKTIRTLTDDECETGYPQYTFFPPVRNPVINGSDWGEPNGTDVYGNPSTHWAIDLNPPEDTPITASAYGIVHTSDLCKRSSCNDLMITDPDHARDADVNGGYGNVVVVEYLYKYLPQNVQSQLKAGQSLFVLYAHLDSLNVKSGQVVHSGDALGIVGSSGNSSGTHVHIELRPGFSTSYGFGNINDQWWDWRRMVPIINPHDVWASIPYRNPR